jgi:crotonobetainyl-CoA:carnitine CoA-transferase CaiB-like acyl-CoA transferase|tara:strand:- start:2489 stop:4906 length:2418 start_codon:yes stop_codon:yes gene_type:complete
MKTELFKKINVLDLGIGPVAGLASMILADFGASVLCIEKPGGDPFRKMGSSPVWMRGKESIALNLSSKKGKQELALLLKNTDVVISARNPKQQQKLGIGFHALQKINPNIIYCTISAFGEKGKYANYPGYESIVSAIAGRMQTLSSITKRKGPSYSIVPVASHAAAFNSVSGIVSALIVREKTHIGQLVQINLLKSLMLYDFHELFLNQLSKKNKHLYGPNGEFGTIDKMPALSYQPFLTKDNQWIQTGNLVDRLFKAFAKEMNLDEELIEQSNQAFFHKDFLIIKEKLRKIILIEGRKKTANYWLKKFIKNGNIAAEIYLNTKESMKQKDIVKNKNIISYPDPILGKIKQVGFFANFSNLKPSIKNPAPQINEHHESTLANFKASKSRSKKPLSNNKAPLESYTIIEIASVIAAPLASSMLADLGARVIKIEPPNGDPFRSYRDEIPITKVNVGKESIAIDLKTKNGKKIMHQLLKNADILIHNNRPGVAERLGFDYKSIKKINKNIIFTWVNAYGSKGDSANRPGAHPIAGAVLGGALKQAGQSIHDKKIDYNKLNIDQVSDIARQIHAANEPSPDPNTSVVAATAMILGLYNKEVNKQGQNIEVNMLGANSYAQIHEFYNYKGRQKAIKLDDELLGTSPFNMLYKTKNNTWVLLKITNLNEWKKCCDIIKNIYSHSKISYKDYGNNAKARINLEIFFKKYEANKLEKIFIDKSIACVKADGEKFGDFIIDNQHAKLNQLVSPITTKWGTLSRHSPVINFSKSKNIITSPMQCGEHTKAILKELGYEKKDVNNLIKEKVVSAK